VPGVTWTGSGGWAHRSPETRVAIASAFIGNFLDADLSV
jgi:hypothetical protein